MTEPTGGPRAERRGDGSRVGEVGEAGGGSGADDTGAVGPGGSVADILVRIVERRRRRLAPFRGAPPARSASPRPLLSAADNPFLAALARQRGRAVIAEVKLGSPSLGSLRGRFDPLEVARTYARAGAAALSVVVEPDFFHGSYELLHGCRQASGLPTIAKDFVVDPLQLQWARDAGADAILLVAALYSRDELHAYGGAARELGLVPLVEVHDLGDLGRLAGGRWELVGVNNRDLRTFKVAIEHGLALASTLPTEALRVAESGIHSPADLHALRSAGYDAFLIGESLLLAEDPGRALAGMLA
jgi:indole-3-glycerol phosphate synthase